jgi:hypothetical protein
VRTTQENNNNNNNNNKNQPTMETKRHRLPMVSYLCNFCETLPRTNILGELIQLPKGSIGKVSKQRVLDKQYRLSKKQVPVYVNDTFPSYPLYEIPNPSQRAAKILKRDNFTWTVENIKEAAECFRIPTGTKVLLFMPKIFFCNELLKHDNFRVKRKSPISGEQVVTGVKPCCPWCKNNSGVEFRCWECQNSDDAPRKGVHINASITPFFGARYWCKSSECVGKPLMELLMLALVILPKLARMVIRKRTRLENKKFGAVHQNLLPTTAS